jgi:hypothetical protein
MRRVGWLVAAMCTLGCGQSSFACLDDEQCGADGQCEASGFCSFPDPECASGRRYGKHAGELSGTCVGEHDGTSAAATSGSTDGGPNAGPGSMGTDDDDTGSPMTTSVSSTTGESTGEASTEHDPCPWSWQRTVTIDGGLTSSDLVDFPALVRITDAALADDAQTDGRDIRFVDASGLLSHEIELFDPASGNLVAWVRVPSLAAGASTTFSMQWGNPVAQPQEEPQAVWDEDFLGVWHMNAADAGEGTILDSSANAHHGTPMGGLGEDDVIPGMVGLALDLDGVDDNVMIPNGFKGSLTQYTLSAWANVTQGSNTNIFWRLNGDGLYPRGDVLANGSYRMQLRIDGVVDLIYSPSSIAPGVHHFVFVYSMAPGTLSELWLDGDLIASKSLTGSSISGGQHDLRLGLDTDLNAHLEGLLDEVRLSGIVRSHAWISATYRIQAQTDRYLSFGAIEPTTLCP